MCWEREIVYSQSNHYHFLTGVDFLRGLHWCVCSACCWMLLLSSTECILIGVSSQSSPQQRRCAYHMTVKEDMYTTAGNVSGSVQLCKNTQCCVGYYVVIDGQPKADVLGKEIQTRTTGLLSEGLYVHCVLLMFLLQLVIKWRRAAWTEPARPRYSGMFAPLSAFATRICATATSPGAKTHGKSFNTTARMTKVSTSAPHVLRTRDTATRSYFIVVQTSTAPQI